MQSLVYACPNLAEPIHYIWKIPDGKVRKKLAMRKNTLISIVLAVALCTLTAMAGMMGLGGLAVKKSPILADLPGVHVKVALRNSKELEKHSPIFIEQYLRTKLESILRKRHITLFSEDELSSVPGRPVLQVRITSGIDKRLLNLVVINVTIGLIEDVHPARNANMRIRATTLLRSSALLANFEELELVDESVDKQITSFCDLYDAANPRPGIDTKIQVKDSKREAKKNSTEYLHRKLSSEIVMSSPINTCPALAEPIQRLQEKDKKWQS